MPGCAIVLVHGVGSQKKTWSDGFRAALSQEMGADAGNVSLFDAWWAPLSTLKETFRPTLAGTRIVASDIENDVYQRTVRDFARMLAAEAGAPVGLHTFGPGDVIDFIKNKLPDYAEGAVADVGNYVARNGVRVGVQSVLHDALGDAKATERASRVMIVAHSQGTIISYDVLRQAGVNYPGVRTWVTMGCPLRKYLAFPLHWGQRQYGVPASLRWLNLYDKKDFVGKDLKGALDWQKPQPVDVVVDNARQAGGAHNHWANPQVVQAIANEARKLLP